ncbi:hypothetical protein BCR39DRAFT_540190 [Naematelia encephala]|uniref:Zn(2)-C6 fungal-type domain-containing protein n=1 Tax=Naematelia encephala TaxID=71784 RepID=A0A1Y2AW32_9TREE|nr:hypothetical protein BCR39DRAFT_540190 [Naematelia encephala]
MHIKYINSRRSLELPRVICLVIFLVCFLHLCQHSAYSGDRQCLPMADIISPKLPPARVVMAVRACLRCRKHKSKCVVSSNSESAKCRRCEEASAECAFAYARNDTEQSEVGRWKNGTSSLSDLERSVRDLRSRLERVETYVRERGGDLDGDGVEEFPAVSTEADSPKRSPGAFIDLVDKEDLVDAGALRFGREDRDTPPGRGLASRKRRREDSGEPEESLQQLAFEIFRKRCIISVPFIDPDSPSYNPTSVRSRSLLLYWAILAVASREAAELQSLHSYARPRAVEGARQTLEGRAPSIDDFIGYCIVQIWLSPIRPPGHLVGMAIELGLHASCKLPINEDTLERMRLWCFTVVFDRISSLGTGKPPICPLGDVLDQCSTININSTPQRLVRDTRIMVQGELTAILCKEALRSDTVYDRGQSPNGPHFLQQKNNAIDQWLVRWLPWANSSDNGEGVFTPHAALLLQHSFAKLHVNLRALQGLKGNESVTSEQLVSASTAVTHAQELLRISLRYFKAPVICYTSETTHLHITFAAVFLLKIMRLLPTSFDNEGILNQVRATVTLLSHVRGKYHAECLQVMVDHVSTKILRPAAQTTVHAAVPAAQPDQLTTQLGFPDGWEDAMTGSNFFGWDASTLLGGQGGNSFSLFGDYLS